MKKMDKILVLLILAISSVSMAAKGYKVDYQDLRNDSFELNFNLDDYNIKKVVKDGVDFSIIDFENKVKTTEKGYAELPFLSASVKLNSNDDLLLEVSESDYIDYQLDYPLLPSKGKIYRDQNPETIAYKIDEKSIIDEWYPKNLAESSDPFILREVRGANILVYPFRYNAKKQILRVYRKMKVKVSPDFSKSTNPLADFAKKTNSVMSGVYKSLFVNYEKSGKFNHEIAELGNILVIFTERDAAAIAPYVEWKRKKGFIVHTEVVATGTNVSSLVQGAYDYDNDILYVQLVGDWTDIKSDTQQFVPYAPTDPTLGCVAGNDSYPDLIVGRFSAQNANDVTIQVNKTINYEKNPDNSGSWYKNAMGIASMGGNKGSGDDEESDIAHMDVIRTNRLLPYNYTTVHQDYDPYVTASTVTGRVNNGLGLINYVGHGSHSSWVSSNFGTSDIVSLTNGSKLPFIFSVACVNGQFHVTNADCFAEAWLKKDNGGAVAMIASTINQSWAPPMRGQDYMNDLLIGGYNYTANPGSGISIDEQRTTFGSICFNGMILMVSETNSDFDMLQTWHIFGDASLHRITNSAEESVEGAVVALTKDGVTFKGVTNAEGEVSIAHTFTSSGIENTVKLVVTAYNTQTILSELPITVFEGPNVILEEFSIVDDNNGEADYGETINLSVILKNIGTESSNNITAILTTESSLINSIGDAEESVSSIGVGERVTLNSSFELTFTPEITDQTTIDFNLMVTDNYSKSTYNNSFRITVNAPAYNISHFTGNINPGDTKNLTYTITNSGHCPVFDLDLLLTQESALNISLENESQNLDQLAVGASYDMVVPALFDAAISPASIASFKLGINDQLGVDTIYQHDILVGMTEDFESGGYSTNSWLLEGSVNWTMETESPFGGTFSARSGAVDHGNTTSITLEVDCGSANDSISFYRRVSCETGYDLFKFYIDGELNKTWSGNLDWEKYTAYGINVGVHQFKWEYTKDESESMYEDCVWIDNIIAPISSNSIGDGLLAASNDLMQNYPNPFNPNTQIRFMLKENSNISLNIYNSSGQFVSSLVNGLCQKGMHAVNFTAQNLSTGIYYYTLRVEEKSITKKMLLVK